MKNKIYKDLSKKELQELIENYDEYMTSKSHIPDLPIETYFEEVFIRQMEEKEKFEKELTELLNKYSMDNDCNTPDFILSEMIMGMLKVIKHTNKKNSDWHK